MSQPLFAQLWVQDSVINMGSLEQSRAIELSNSSNQPLRVQINLTEVLNPESNRDDTETTAPVSSALISLETSSLIIPPMANAKVVIQNTSRLIDQEEVYRLSIKPQYSAPDAQPIDRDVRANSGMNILLNYSLLLFVKPQDATARVRLHRHDKTLSLVNNGNSNVKMKSIAICDASTEACQTLPTKRLYAKQRWILSVPLGFDFEHTFVQTVQSHEDGFRKIHYTVPTASANY